MDQSERTDIQPTEWYMCVYIVRGSGSSVSSWYLFPKMMKLSMLFLAVWLHVCSSRRLTDSLDNDLGSTSNALGFTRPKDWVRISQIPVPLLSKPVGSRVELECEAIGSPAPTVQWLKDNTPLTENESFESNLINDLPGHGIAKVRSRLVIPAAIRVHEASFTCIAESGSQVATAKSRLFITRNGVSDRNFTQLLTDELLGSSQPPRVVLYYTIYMDTIGNDVILPCKAVGNPLPTTIWLDPNEEVLSEKNDMRVSILLDGSLRIRNIRWADMGPYTCVARNMLNQDSITTFLYPMLAESK